VITCAACEGRSRAEYHMPTRVRTAIASSATSEMPHLARV
jgi:hypothetical protein